MATTFTVCRCNTSYVAEEISDQNEMVNKIRRLKITVHTKELVVLKPGTGHETTVTEITDLDVCPVCHTPMRFLAAADHKPEAIKTKLIK